MRIAIVLALVGLLAVPSASAVLPHYERGVAQLTHAIATGEGEVCRSQGAFVFDTRSGSFVGTTSCGTVVEEFGCDNGDVGWHACYAEGATLFVEDAPDYPRVRLAYERLHPDGRVERAEGSGYSLLGGPV